jgi:hypothetical protein
VNVALYTFGNPRVRTPFGVLALGMASQPAASADLGLMTSGPAAVGNCSEIVFTCENGRQVEHCTPGQPSQEVCNYLDDDCDGIGDNNIPIPLGPPQIGAERAPDSGAAVLSWPAVPAALTYDVLRGRLPLLVTSGGDYSVATDLCLIDNVELTSWRAPEIPAPGDAYWYLVRASNCIGASSYDVGENGLAAPRDPGIAASPSACP